MTPKEKLIIAVLNTELPPQEVDAYIRALKEIEFLDVDYSKAEPKEILGTAFIWNSHRQQNWFKLYDVL